MKKTANSNADAPFYYVEGKGWKINQCYTHPEFGAIHVCKQFFRTKSDAKAAYSSVLQAAIDAKARKLSFKKYGRQQLFWEDFSEQWKEERLSHQVKGNTWYSKDRPMMNKYFNPIFKGKRVCDCFTEEKARIIKANIQNAMTHFGYPVPTVDKNRAIVFYLAMLDFAYENDYMTDSDEYRHCRAVMKRFKDTGDASPTQGKRPPVALSVAQVNSLISAIPIESMDYVLTKLLFQAGFRINEALALLVSDVDVSQREISISNTVAPDEDGNLRRFNRTKTKNGYRTVPVTEEIASLLANHISDRMLRPEDFLFPGIKANQQMDGSAYRRRLAAYCKAAGVPVVTPHSARHTFSTNAHLMGYRPEVIAQILGHTVMVDVNVYNHLATKEKARAMIEEMFPKVPRA